MDSMEINKLVGAAVGALLIFLGANFFSELAYFGSGAPHGEHEYAYSIETEAAHEEAPAEAEAVDIAALMAAADPASGEKLFGKCKACHKIEPGANATGPTLHGVVGRTIGAEAGYGYSAALTGLDRAWTYEELDAFLAKPKEYAPGTKMSFAGLSKPEDRADMIAYLETLAN